MPNGAPGLPVYPPRVVSGIQPSSEVHLGHYFGAMRQHLGFQHEYPGESFCLIADYHVLTRNGDPRLIREHTIGLATAYLALGLDPNKAVLYRQSDVPQALELFWILSCYANDSELRQLPTYKEAAADTSRTIGLLTYPVLMAADVLGLRATAMPVGKDQDASIERLRDIARRYNHVHGVPFFPVPTPRYSDSPRVLGTDGEKMHSAYKNTIRVFDTFPNLNRAIHSIRTSSAGRRDGKDPATCTIFHLYSLVARSEEVEMMRGLYRAGEIGYDDAKRKLVGALQEYFAEASDRHEDLRARPSFVEDVLREGYRAAAEQIDITVDHVRQMVGLTY